MLGTLQTYIYYHAVLPDGLRHLSNLGWDQKDRKLELQAFAYFGLELPQIKLQKHSLWN